VSANIHSEIARTLEPWVGHFAPAEPAVLKPSNNKPNKTGGTQNNEDLYATYFNMRDARNSITKDQSQSRIFNNLDVFNGSKALEVRF